MKTFVTAASLAIGVSAAILPRNDECCFQLSASGGVSGTLGQLDDGQNRVGGGLGKATYCINGDTITDESGRGCILTAPTTQFQCDKGATPDGGFSVGSNGMVQHDGDGTFYACPADEGEYNIYTQPVDNQPKCVKVKLSTGGKCAANAQPSKTPEQPTCPPQQTVTKTEQGKASTIYKTETKYQPTTEYKPTTIVKTETQYSSKVIPTTVYSTKTVEETEYVTKPVTQYKTEQQTVTASVPTTITKTVEEIETATKAVTSYVTKTQQQTVTAETPTTVYKTVEETEYKTVPTTVYNVKTEQQTVTAEKPVTQYQTQTKVIEETQTQQASPQTQYITKTQQAEASTITKVVTHVETQQGKPQTQYVTQTEQQECPQQPQQPTQNTGMPSKPVETAPSKPTQTAPAGACPSDLNGDYQYPHLIVPVSSEHPDQSYGTSYNGMVNSSMNSMFNFDIPQSYQGKTCSLVFMFPKREDLETSDYTYNGQGSMNVDHLANACKESDSWNSAPKVESHMGSISPQPGNSYTIWTGECPAGTAQSYEMSSEGGMSMDFFQDYNPCPLGLYMTTS